MPITLYQFNSLSFAEKGRVVIDKGEFIACRKEDRFSIALYQLESFYVEVYYHPALNEIQRFRAFSSTSQLEPYLSKIDIESVLA